MEACKDHPTPYPGKVKQRIGLKSSHKEKEDKTSSEMKTTPKRDKRLLSVSKSVSQLDLSIKDRPSRSTRRLSVPSKYATPVTKFDNKISASTLSSTISENKPTSKPDFVVGPLVAENKGKVTAKSLSVSFQGAFGRTQGRANGASKDAMPTPTTQEVPKTGQRKKFSTLMSASYWLAQIKVAESAGKHAISLGFFKLALECTSEPLQRVRDEMKSYTKRHNLLELGEVAKEVLQNYGLLEEVVAEAEAKPEPKDAVNLVLEACPLIPENVEEGEEEYSSGSDCKDSKKMVTVASSPKVKVAKARKAVKSDSNRKVDDDAEKSEVLPSPIDRNKTVQNMRKPSAPPVTKTQPSILRKSSTNPEPKDTVNLVLEACPLIPENVEEGEEEYSSGSDCKDFKKILTVASSPKVKVAKARKAVRSDSNRHPSTEKVDDDAEKSEVLPSPIDRNKTVQKMRKPSAPPVTKPQPSIFRKSSTNPIDKVSVNSQRHAARRASMTPAMTKTGQTGSQKDKGSNMNKPSQLDTPSSMENNTEQDKENLDFQQTESAFIQEDSTLLVQD